MRQPLPWPDRPAKKVRIEWPKPNGWLVRIHTAPDSESGMTSGHRRLKGLDGDQGAYICPAVVAILKEGPEKAIRVKTQEPR